MAIDFHDIANASKKALNLMDDTERDPDEDGNGNAIIFDGAAAGVSYWEWHVRNFAVTVYHPVGTAKMGEPGAAGTVVDPQLRVVGVDGLRVADASIMPTLISGNTNAPCIMIGERVADFILSSLQGR